MEFNEARSCVMLFVVCLIYSFCLLIDEAILLITSDVIFKWPIHRQGSYVSFLAFSVLMVIAFFQLLAIIHIYDWWAQRRDRNSSESDLNEEK